MNFIKIWIVELIKYLLVFFYFVIIFTSLFTKPVFSAYSLPVFLRSPSEATSYISCPEIECSDNTAECANSENPGNCGLPACGGGDPWTKYYKVGCARLPGDDCNTLYSPGDKMYSIGDKCVSGEAGLRSSNCTGTQSTTQYKTCCTNTTPSYVVSAPQASPVPSSCVQYSGDTTNPPYEGSCPTGSTAKFCGFGTNPACGQEACGSVCGSV